MGQDKAGKEVIFKPEKGSQFSLKLDTLLSGLVVQKPLHKEKKAEKKIIPLSKQEKEIQPQAQRKIVYDGSKDKPRMRRDGKNVLD
ncbi:TPA: hypothetical protein DEP21_04810 [Patescibacteria group bacterium]|nr:hypothetical protein [Candidatus Gracilibacteria bacterium]